MKRTIPILLAVLLVSALSGCGGTESQAPCAPSEPAREPGQTAVPAEAEWEYACRAGTDTPFNTETSVSADEANDWGHYPYLIEDNYFSQGNPETKPGVYRQTTVAVGSFEPNAWGLYDMRGNAGEWVWDWYGGYEANVQADPAGPVSGSKEDKSQLFQYQIGEGGAPVIHDAPVSMSCTVEDIYEAEGFESFICKIAATYAEESVLTPEGKIDYRTLKPVLFEFPTCEYLKTGEIIGQCKKLGEYHA